jgi:hypothetical protein
MLVSTRETTRKTSIVVVQLLTRPAAIFAANVRPFGSCFFELVGLEFIQPLRVGIEKRKPLLGRQLVPGSSFRTGQLNSNALARGNPLQLVPRADAILVGDRLGDGQLEFGSHFGHILTLSRIIPYRKGLSQRLSDSPQDRPTII